MLFVSHDADVDADSNHESHPVSTSATLDLRPSFGQSPIAEKFHQRFFVSFFELVHFFRRAVSRRGPRSSELAQRDVFQKFDEPTNEIFVDV
jgi:hypothetical protein